MTEERRQHQRVSLKLLGRFMLPDRNEYPCQVLNMSPGGIALSTPICGDVGDRVVVYIDQVGRVEGTVSRVFDGGFAVDAVLPERKRERLADQLTWLANQSLLSDPEARRDPREVPDNPLSNVVLADGTRVPCTILDMSVSGASVSCQSKPQIGEDVMLGRTRGRVVRHHEDGFAIAFMQRTELTAFSGHFRRDRLIA